MSPLNLCKRETKDISGDYSFEIFCLRKRKESKEFTDCVLLNYLKREKGDTKEFRRLVLCSFGKKGEERHKKNSGD